MAEPSGYVNHRFAHLLPFLFLAWLSYILLTKGVYLYLKYCYWNNIGAKKVLPYGPAAELCNRPHLTVAELSSGSDAV